MSVHLHPDWLKVEERLGSRPCLLGSIQDIRASAGQIAEILNPLYPVPSPEPTTYDETFEEGYQVRVFTPGGDHKRPLPVGVYYHSGGWCSGNIEAEKATCIYLAHELPAVIVSVGYRLGPEFKSPTAHNDAFQAYIWARENASTLGGDPSQYFTIGGSAGGNLAITVALRAAECDMAVAGVVTIVPVTVHPDAVPSQFQSAYTSYKNSADTPIINVESMDIFFKNYNAKPEDPLTFPLLNPKLSLLPRTYIVSCSADPLRDDARLLKKELDRYGIENKLDEYDGMPHYFWIFPELKQRGEFLKNLLAGTHFILGRDVTP